MWPSNHCSFKTMHSCTSSYCNVNMCAIVVFILMCKGSEKDTAMSRSWEGENVWFYGPRGVQVGRYTAKMMTNMVNPVARIFDARMRLVFQLPDTSTVLLQTLKHSPQRPGPTRHKCRMIECTNRHVYVYMVSM